MAEDAKPVRVNIDGVDYLKAPDGSLSQPPSPLKLFMDAVNSIPDRPDDPNLAVQIGTIPAQMVVGMVKSTLQSVIKLADASGRAAAGDTSAAFDPMDVMNTFALGSPAGAARAGSVGIFGGRLPKAKEQQILSKGPRGHTYHEMDVSKGKFKMGSPNVEYNLNDVFHLPELYDLYPELKHTRVRFDPKADTSEYYYGKITVGTKDRSPEDTFKVLVHEIQHGVQHQDIADSAMRGERGRPSGTSPFAAQEETGDLYRAMAVIQATGKKIPPGVADEVKRLYQMAPHVAYRTHVGELEAEQAEMRAFMTRPERQVTPPNFSTFNGQRASDVQATAKQLQEAAFPKPKVIEAVPFGKRVKPPE